MTIPTLVTNQTQIKDLISKLGHNYICLPNLTNNILIIDYLKTIDGSIGHPTNDNKLIVKHEDIFYIFEKPDKTYFENNISSTDSALTLKESIYAIKEFTNLKNVLGFTKEQIDAFNINIVDSSKIISNTSTFFMVTFKNGGQYLDFVSWDETGASCNYSCKSSHGLIHSGDNSHHSYFMQSVKLDKRQEEPFILGERFINKDFILGGIGYNHTELMDNTFKDQKPSMCYYDPVSNTIGVIPFQQTRAILGTSTTIACATIKHLNNDQLKVIPYTTVPLTNKYNTTSRITCDLPTRCFSGVHEVEKSEAEAEASHTNADTNNNSNTDISTSYASSCKEDSEYDTVYLSDTQEIEVMQYTNEPSIVLNLPNSLTLDYLGNTENIGSKKQFNPSLFGTSVKGVNNATIEPASTTISNFDSKLSCLNILHMNETDSFSEDCAKLINPNGKITCLMIIHTLFDTENIVEKLEHLKLSCTKYANHCSIVLAKCNKTNTYYWIRGIRWYHEKVYYFGDVFDKDDFDVIVTEPIVPYPTKLDTMYFKDKIISTDEATDMITKMSFKDFVDNQNDIIELFVQMAMFQESNTFNVFKNKCLTIITSKQSENNKKLKATIVKLIKTQHDPNVKKELDNIKSTIKKTRACRVLKSLVQTILGITADGGASTKAAANSLQSAMRSVDIHKNTSLANSMTYEDICEYLEDIDSFVIGQLIVNEQLIEMLNGVANGTYKGPQQHIMDLHETCSILDGITVSALGTHSAKILHELSGPASVAILCGESEHVSSVPIAILDIFTKIKDPRYFKWFDEVNNPDVAKFRILLRRMICEATMNRDRSINPGSKSLTYFLISMFISLAQSIKSKFSCIPTDETDFTVLAMRNLVGYIFTMCASGTTPITNIWKVLSHYPTKVPGIDAFEIKDFWILQNLIDMFPYCMWSVAEPNFKQNTLIGVTKLLGKYIITKQLDKINDEEMKQLEIKTTEISKDLTIVWQWQKLVIISIVKMLIKQGNGTPCDSKIIKHVAKCLLESYPDIDESMISRKHKKSDSSHKLKKILEVMKTHGNITLNEHQMKTVKFIIAKRMHSYYYNLSKDSRTHYFNKLDINGIYKELSKLVKLESSSDCKGGPANKFFKSWSHSYNSTTKDIIKSNEETRAFIKDLFTLESEVSSGASANPGGAGCGDVTDYDGGGEIVVRYPDMREDLWLSYNDNMKMMKFIEKHELKDMVSILEYVFPEQNVYDIIIDIAGILLDNYKDRAKAYECVVAKYPF